MRDIHTNSKGNIAFYVLFILPLTLGFSAIAIDVSGWNNLREESQRYADRLSLQAAQALPNQDIAKNIIDSGIATLNSQSNDITFSAKTTTTDRSVSVEIQTKFPAVFGRILPQSNAKSIFGVKQQALAERVPLDTVVIISNAHTLAPENISQVSNTSLWGDEIEYATSGYTNMVSIPCLSNHCTQSQIEDYKRFLTLSCFNQIFTPFKVEAISLIKNLEQITTNRISLLYSPGSLKGQPFDEVAPLEFTDKQTLSFSQNVFSPNLTSDELCVYLSSEEISPTNNYPLPFSSPLLSCELVDSSPHGQLHDPKNRLSACAKEHMKLKESIYFRAARTDNKSPLSESIEKAIARAIALFSQANAEDSVKRRGALGNRAKKSIVVLSDHAPDPTSDAFQKLISDASVLGIELLIALYAHPALSEAQILALEDFKSAISDSALIKVSIANDPETLQTNVQHHYQSLIQEPVLKR